MVHNISISHFLYLSTHNLQILFTTRYHKIFQTNIKLIKNLDKSIPYSNVIVQLVNCPEKVW